MPGMNVSIGRFCVWRTQTYNYLSYGIRFGTFQVTRQGIWFPYCGDELLWSWPWARADGCGIVSVLWGAGFKNLAAFRRFEREANQYFARQALRDPTTITIGFTP